MLSDTTNVLEFALSPEFLFSDGIDRSKAKVRFAPMVFADARYGNHSNLVTENDLARVRLSSLALPNAYAIPPPRQDGDDQEPKPPENLRDYIELVLLPRALRVQGEEPCPDGAPVDGR